MADHKTWPWKKKSAEKSLVVADKVNLTVGGEHEEEIKILQNNKAELEKSIQILTDKLASALAEAKDKDDIGKQQARMAQEAIAGWEKAESEAISIKEELDKAIQQIVAGEERLINLDAALKECMQQLRFVREEQEKRIHDALTKTSSEFHKTRIVLEEKLAESSKKLSKLTIESNQLSKTLLTKEKIIEDFKEQSIQADANFSNLKNRLDSIEKENSSFKYEVRLLEKELEIRNEEIEFNRRTSYVAHKQHLESAKRIAKLESECQRLCVLVRKRLPGPAALAKMKNEVENMGRDSPGRRISYLTEQLYAMEKENKILKETLHEKLNELQLSKSQPINQLASVSDFGSDEKASCVESWTSGVNSEMDNYKMGKQKIVGSSDMNLMDDFAEMEQLAIVGPLEKSNLELSKSIQKVIEIVDGIHLPNKDDETQKNDYTVRVFQWKTCDIVNVLERFVRTCYDLISGKADLANFAKEIACDLEWIMNHCFSIQDVSSMKDELKKHHSDIWDESRSESELEGCNISSNVSKDESEKLNYELEAEIGKTESLTGQLKESEKSIENLQMEIDTLKQSHTAIQDQIETHVSENKDISSKLTSLNLELDDTRQKNFALEEDLGKNICCEEFETACMELPLQLQSMTKQEVEDHKTKEAEKQLQNDWEMTAASQKLAECQETILNLGKQINALASKDETTPSEKLPPTSSNSCTISTASPKKNLSRRTSLLDKMLADDDGENSRPLKQSVNNSIIGPNVVNDSKAIVPSKKRSGRGLWKKIFQNGNQGIKKKSVFGC